MSRRRRLARTLSPARWPEYRRLLRAAAGTHGYALVSLEDWIAEPTPRHERTLILRHDVDQHPRSALRMAAIERELGVTSTWYFRWRTADATVIRRLRAHGHAVGLHYETLTRTGLREGWTEPPSAAQITAARDVLRAEISAFEHRFGPTRSACPHGDTRIEAVSNAVLLHKRDPRPYGVEFDGNAAMSGRGLGAWCTDRAPDQGGWRAGVDLDALLRAGTTPILSVTHPHHWSSGSGLLRDRVLQTALPAPVAGTGSRPIRTRSDDPPASVPPFAP